MHFGGLFLWLTFLLSYPFYQKNWRTLILLVRLLVPPVQTSGGVYLGFQCPTCMFCFLHALNYLDLDSPLVQHLLISWQTVWHPRPFAHLLFKRWCFYLSLYSLFQGLNRIPWTVLTSACSQFLDFKWHIFIVRYLWEYIGLLLHVDS